MTVNIMDAMMTTDDFLAKIEWEGGFVQAVEYGLAPEDADDPSDPRLKDFFSFYKKYVIVLAPRYEDDPQGGEEAYQDHINV